MITHNTYLNTGTFTIVRLYETDIVMFNEKQIVLNAGNWKTRLTKKRMNQVSEDCNLGYTVFQRDGQWFVEHNGFEKTFDKAIVLER